MDEKLRLLSKMSYFAKCKKQCLQHMLKLCPPVTDELCAYLDIFYTSYFAFFVGLLDFLIENKLLTKEICITFFETENNYYYVRNLRNSIIHRAEDLSNQCIVDRASNIIIPVVPTVFGQDKKTLYTCFCDTLLGVIKKCESMNTIFLKIIEDNRLFSYKDLTKEEFFVRAKQNIFSAHKTDKECEKSWEIYTQTSEARRTSVKSRILSYFSTEFLI